MAYQLKDKELQQQLDEISFGAFSEELAARTGDLDWLYNDSHVESVRICFNRKGRLRHTPSGERFSVLITAEDIEKTVDFKDGTWNNFDVVRPPVGVWLAVEYDEFRYDGQKVRRGFVRSTSSTPTQALGASFETMEILCSASRKTSSSASGRVIWAPRSNT